MRTKHQDAFSGGAWPGGRFCPQPKESSYPTRVHFVGRLGHERLAAFYRKASVFILPSRLETFGHPLVEAMASVVASDIPVCREICRDATRYFPPDDIETMVNQVRTVLREPGVRGALVQKGLERAQDFNWDSTAEQLVQVFEEIAGARRHLRG